MGSPSPARTRKPPRPPSTSLALRSGQASTSSGQASTSSGQASKEGMGGGLLPWECGLPARKRPRWPHSGERKETGTRKPPRPPSTSLALRSGQASTSSGQALARHPSKTCDAHCVAVPTDSRPSPLTLALSLQGRGNAARRGNPLWLPGLRRACLRQGAGSAGFQPASRQDACAPRGAGRDGESICLLIQAHARRRQAQMFPTVVPGGGCSRLADGSTILPDGRACPSTPLVWHPHTW